MPTDSKPNRLPPLAPSVPSLRPGGWLNPAATSTPSASSSRSHSFHIGGGVGPLTNSGRSSSGLNTPGDPVGEAGGKKPKDLSHVPCKFFKSGGCTAGSACVFAHVVAEPGQQKQTCQYFQKGSCKFGHKCALAHLLPGQPMSMDRKNKRAVQLQTQALNNNALQSPTQPDFSSATDSLASKLANLHSPTNASLVSALSQQIASSPRSGQHLSNSNGMPSTPPADVLSNGWQLETIDRASSRADSQAVHGFFSMVDFGAGSTSTTPTSAYLSTSPPAHVSRPAVYSSSNFSGPSGLNPSRDPLAIPISARRPSLSTALSSTSLFSSSPSRRLIPPLSSSVNVSGEASPFSSSPFAAPGAKNMLLSSSYETHFSNLEQMAFSSPLYLPSGGLTSPQSVFRQPLLTEGAVAVGRFHPSLLDDEDGPNDGVDGDEGEELLPGSLSELLTEHEMERRMIRRSSSQVPGLKALSKSAAPTFPIGEGRPVLKMGFTTGNGLSHGGAIVVPASWNDDPAGGNEEEMDHTTIGRASNVSPRRRNPLPFGDFHSLDDSASRSFANLSMKDSQAPLSPPSIPLGSSAPWERQPPALSYAAATSPLTNSTAAARQHALWPPSSSSSKRDVLQHAQPILSPSSKALASHPPGTSLPPGLGAAPSRLHFQPPTSPSAFTPFQPQTNGAKSPSLAGYPSIDQGFSTLTFGTAVTIASSPRTQQATTYDQQNLHRATNGDRPGPTFPTVYRNPWDGNGLRYAPEQTAKKVRTEVEDEDEDEFADDVLFN